MPYRVWVRVGRVRGRGWGRTIKDRFAKVPALEARIHYVDVMEHPDIAEKFGVEEEEVTGSGRGNGDGTGPEETDVDGPKHHGPFRVTRQYRAKPEGRASAKPVRLQHWLSKAQSSRNGGEGRMNQTSQNHNLLEKLITYSGDIRFWVDVPYAPGDRLVFGVVDKATGYRKMVYRDLGDSSIEFDIKVEDTRDYVRCFELLQGLKWLVTEDQ